MSTHDEFMVSAAVRHVARAAVAHALVAHPPEWGDYPEIGEHDWERVEAEVERIIDRLSGQAEKYESAYRFLASRANGGAA